MNCKVRALVEDSAIVASLHGCEPIGQHPTVGAKDPHLAANKGHRSLRHGAPTRKKLEERGDRDSVRERAEKMNEEEGSGLLYTGTGHFWRQRGPILAPKRWPSALNTVRATLSFLTSVTLRYQ